MSIYIKVIKAINPIHNGGECLYNTTDDAAKNLIESNVLPSEWSGMHSGSIIRRGMKKRLINAVKIKGTITADKVQTIPTSGSVPAMPLSEERRAFLNKCLAKKGAETETEEEEETTEETTSQETQTQTSQTEERDMLKELKDEMQQLHNAATTQQQGSDAMMPLAQMLAPSLSKLIQPNYDWAMDAINKVVTEAIAAQRPHKVEIYVNDEMKGATGRTHFQFDKIMRALTTRVPLWITGEAGAGKTHSVHQAAEVLSLPYYSLSCGIETGKHELFGYMSATGEYSTTAFRNAYENGGVFLFDEIDAGSAEVFTSMNAALANSGVTFPCGTYVKKHKDFIAVACANTTGDGANMKYVGRQQIDKATTDRFAMIHFKYDEELEMDICGNRDWARLVQRLRHKIKEVNPEFIVSPRASINGAKLLAAGFTESEVVDMVVLKGAPETIRNQVKGMY